MAFKYRHMQPCVYIFKATVYSQLAHSEFCQKSKSSAEFYVNEYFASSFPKLHDTNQVWGHTQTT